MLCKTLSIENKCSVNAHIFEAHEYDMKKIFEFRYKNYDMNDKKSRFPEGLIYDEFDDYAYHCVLLHENEKIHGCIRAVRSDLNINPLEGIFNLDFLLRNYNWCLVSSLFVLPDHRNGKCVSTIGDILYDFLKSIHVQIEVITFKEGNLKSFYQRRGFEISTKAHHCNSKICPNPHDPHLVGMRFIKNSW